MLDNPIWHALQTEHARFALVAPSARKYPANVAPFAGTPDNTPDSLRDLCTLLTPGETVYLAGDTPPAIAELTTGETIPCWQMTAPAIPKQADRHPHLSPIRLSPKDAEAVLALTTISSPGFFRSRTQEMGAYFGLFIDGGLIAMAGERMAHPHGREISGVCTHPAHTGQGYAAKLITHLIEQHAQTGLQSFLHVATANTRALSLYKSLGFSIRRQLNVHAVTRTERYS